MEILKTESLKDKLVYDRQPPLFDMEIVSYQFKLNGNNHADPNTIAKQYFATFDDWIHSSELNNLTGLDALKHRDFCVGVTGYLDDLYVRYGKGIRYLKGEYSYHWRLGVGKEVKEFTELKKGDQFIISEPFAFSGAVHPDIEAILDHCDANGVDVHIDSAWFGCVRDFDFNYNRPCIKSAGFSLSKGLSNGHNRIGIRYARTREAGPITIMGDFNMGVAHLMWLGVRLMERYGPDFLQNKYRDIYLGVCEDLGLKPKNAIHIAMGPNPNGKGGWMPVGVSEILKIKEAEQKMAEKQKVTGNDRAVFNFHKNASFVEDEVEYKSVDGMSAIIPYHSSWKRVLVLVSGGLDSSLMLYLITKTFQERGSKAEIIPVNFEIPTKVGIRESARNVIKTVQGITKHPLLKDPIELEIPLAHSRGAQKVNFIDKEVRRLIREMDFDFNYNGVTANPPERVRQHFSEDFFRDPERDFRTTIYNAEDSASPLSFLNKKGVVFLLNKFGLIDALTTQSCSCDANIDWLEENNLKAPCGECWWCQERAWGFASNGIEDPSLKTEAP